MNTTTSSPVTTTANPLPILQNLLTQYSFVVIFILSNISNISNILVFLQKSLRSNVCSWYFAFVSLGHLIFLYFGSLTRIITAWSGYDLTRVSLIYCQIRVYFLTISLLLAKIFLCSISIDRWMITSPKQYIRQLSSLKKARWFILCILTFSIIFSINFPIWYRMEGTRGCVGASNTYFPLFFTIYNLIIQLAPFFIMIFFSLLALRNLRDVRRRQINGSTQVNGTTASTNSGQQFKRKDLQFIKLAMIQVLIYILFNIFYAYTSTYGFITQSAIKTPERVALDSFLNTIALIISYSYMAITFFLYTMVSSTFRRESILTIKRMTQWIF